MNTPEAKQTEISSFISDSYKILRDIYRQTARAPYGDTHAGYVQWVEGMTSDEQRALQKLLIYRIGAERVHATLVAAEAVAQSMKPMEEQHADN